MIDYEDIIRKTINYIEEHLHECLTLDDVAKQASFSKYHFHRIFRSSIGMSVTEYIRMRRLTNASAALLYTNERGCPKSSI